MAEIVDPRQLSLVELRALRARLQNDDDAVSYVRRLAQARLDLVQAEKRRRIDGGAESLSDELPSILSAHLTGGVPRPPRPAEDFSSHPLAEQFDALLDHAGDNDLSSLSGEELIGYADALHEFEQARSHERPSCSLASTSSAPSWFVAIAMARPTSTACSPPTTERMSLSCLRSATTSTSGWPMSVS